jgi:superfamily I DNA and RNA helicase
MFSTLTDHQIDTIRGIIHPEIRIRTEPAQAISVPEGVKLKDNAEIIKTLDIQQEQIATTMGEGHRLFYGVAGSGKTLILLARAKILANQIDTNKILILCFNKVLASYLRSLINQSDNPIYQEKISVQHFHGWAKSVIGSLPNLCLYSEGESGDRQYDEDVSHALQDKIETLALEEKWDAILIDEAHTFESSWFNCCVNALKDPDNGNLMIVADGTQSLYQRKKFTWKSVGVKAVGRSRKLTQNYRNTQEILSAAWAVVSSDFKNSEEIEDLDVDSFPLVRPQDCLRTGKVAILKTMKSSQQQNNILIGDIQECLARNYQPHDLAIIYKGLMGKEIDNFHDLKNQLTNLNIPYYDISKNKSDFNIQEPGIRMVTAKSSLGLEFKVVFIIWVQMFGIDEAESKKQLYVAMTRAQEELYLYGYGGFDFMESLASNPYLQLVKK